MNGMSDWWIDLAEIGTEEGHGDFLIDPTNLLSLAVRNRGVDRPRNHSRQCFPTQVIWGLVMLVVQPTRSRKYTEESWRTFRYRLPK